MQPFFFIRNNGRYVKLPVHEIMYLESKKNYVQVVTEQKTFLALITLRQLELELPAELFCRVHRSFIVSMNHVAAFDNDTVQIDNKEIPIRQHKPQPHPRPENIHAKQTRNKNNQTKNKHDTQQK